MVRQHTDQLDQLEYRTLELTVREMPSGGENVVRGTAVVFEKWQQVATGDARAVSGSSRKREKITSEAVRLPDLADIVNEAIDQELRQQHNDIRALVNHNPDRYLGSFFNRSLKLEKTDESLDFELTVPRTSDGNDLLAILENDGGRIPMSVGFKAKGRKSNIKQIDFSDDELEAELNGGAQRAVRKTGVLDNTPINLQEGRLDGSDYVEGNNVKSGRNWRVYRSFDLREISFLIGQEPAWQGVYGQLGSGKPDPNQQARRARELAMVELRC